MASLFGAATFVTVIASRFPAMLVSSTSGVAEGLHQNDASGYLEGPKRLGLAAGRQGRCGVAEPLTAGSGSSTTHSCCTLAQLKQMRAVVSLFFFFFFPLQKITAIYFWDLSERCTKPLLCAAAKPELGV